MDSGSLVRKPMDPGGKAPERLVYYLFESATSVFGRPELRDLAMSTCMRMGMRIGMGVG
jgi:hypothetical protein